MQKANSKATILLVDDHPLVRDGLRILFQQTDDMCLVGESPDGEGAMRLVQELNPDVVVMDIGLPGCDGIETTRQIKSLLPNTKVIMLTAHDREDEIVAAFAAGADGYCIKSIDAHRLLTAIRAVKEGSAYLDPIVADLVLRKVVPIAHISQRAAHSVSHTHSPLSKREMEVVALIADGTANQDIAEKLHVSVGTVKAYVCHILEKLCVSDRTQAAVIALRKGWI